MSTVTKEEYKKMSLKASPNSKTAKNVACAYVIGGLICTFGQGLFRLLTFYGVDVQNARTWTSVILVVLSALFTGFGLYGKLAKHAGAGTLVPITGFANAVSSAAIEARSEGYITGVGAKIFTIAGPVILYGTTASVAYGLIYYLTGLF